MKRIVMSYPRQEVEDFPADIDRIVAAFAEAGLECTRTQAHMMWEYESQMRFCGWLYLPDTNAEILKTLEDCYQTEEAVRAEIQRERQRRMEAYWKSRGCTEHDHDWEPDGDGRKCRRCRCFNIVVAMP